METKPQRHRHLTRRGYNRAESEVWPVDEVPFSTAPEPSDVAESTSLELWGVTMEQAREMLRRQMCPACGEGPWKSPLNHASRKHGIDRFTMRDACGLNARESVIEADLAANFRSRKLAPEQAAEMARVRDAAARGRRLTRAGRTNLIQNLRDWEVTDPERAAQSRREAAALSKAADAQAKRSATFMAKRRPQGGPPG